MAPPTVVLTNRLVRTASPSVVMCRSVRCNAAATTRQVVGVHIPYISEDIP